MYWMWITDDLAHHNSPPLASFFGRVNKNAAKRNSMPVLPTSFTLCDGFYFQITVSSHQYFHNTGAAVSLRFSALVFLLRSREG